MSYYKIATKKYKNLIKNIDNKDIIILAIESSCDETSIAIVKNGKKVLSNIVASQIDIHARFGGVVPEVASRNHVMAINTVLQQALDKAQLTLHDIDAIGVTYGAGLMGALLVGVTYAKSLAYSLEIPIIKVNHIYGHISANYITYPELKPPFMSLVVSGGHTALIKVTKNNKVVIATTHDDAIGEAYDKVAKVLGLGYPGGPIVDKRAKLGNKTITFIKKPMNKKEITFSYSGLKTAVINYIHKQKQASKEINVDDVCTSFQVEAVDEVVTKTVLATTKHKLDSIVVAGGVAANSYLRQQLLAHGKKHGIKVYFPPLDLCTDNAAMIGAEAYDSIKNKVGLSDIDLTPEPNIHLKYS